MNFPRPIHSIVFGIIWKLMPKMKIFDVIECFRSYGRRNIAIWSEVVKLAKSSTREVSFYFVWSKAEMKWSQYRTRSPHHPAEIAWLHISWMENGQGIMTNWPSIARMEEFDTLSAPPVKNGIISLTDGIGENGRNLNDQAIRPSDGLSPWGHISTKLRSRLVKRNLSGSFKWTNHWRPNVEWKEVVLVGWVGGG